MFTFIQNLLNIMKSRKGQGMVEYGLIIGLVAIVVIGALIALSGGLNGIFGEITTVLEDPEAAAAAASGE